MNRRLISSLAFLAAVLYATSGSAESTGPAVGTIAPDFRAYNVVTGERIPLSSQRGKVVIVTFWATWCAPCRKELPILESTQRKIGKADLTVFAVNYRDEGAARWLKTKASTWQINLIEDRNDWIASHYSISSIPHMFIIGRDGKILANHIGYDESTLDEFVAEINQALREPMPAAPTDSPAISSPPTT